MGKLVDEFEITKILSAIDVLDELRTMLSDNEDRSPADIRQYLSKLHGISMAVFNKGYEEEADEMFQLASDIDFELMEYAERIEMLRSVIREILELNNDAE